MSFDMNDPRITAYVFDELSKPDRAAFEAEMQASEKLRQAVEETRKTVDALSSELKSEPGMSLSDEQQEAVAQEIDKADGHQKTGNNESHGSERRTKSAWHLARRWAIAASLLLACGLTVWSMLPAVQYARESPSNRVARNETKTSRTLSSSRFALTGAKSDSDEMQSQLASSTPHLMGEPASQVTHNVHAVESGREAAPMEDSESEEVPSQLSVLATKIESKHPKPAGPATIALVPGRGTVRKDWELGARSSKPADALGLHAGERPEGESQFSPDQGIGPGRSGDKYSPIVENPFLEVKNNRLSTFSIDVDTASYAKVRSYLMQNRTMPRPDAVRIEELVNYFTYDYKPPTDDVPFAAHVEVAGCPWRPQHRLVRIGIKGKEIEREKRPSSNLVFLLDVSGSMNQNNKLPLLKRGMKMLVDQLGENDRVAIVVYAGAAGMVLESTPGDQKQVILDALDRLHAGGSTNGGQGIRLAYQAALDHFIRGGVNRIILCTDGDFNVGTTGTDELVRLAEKNAKTGVFLSVLGFGMGNHNDSMLEQISNKGNGNYAFIDTDAEARKVLVEEMSGTLVTIAKDVKIQIEFNPKNVAAYRLIGYENRMLAAEDFNDDKKDAGEIGAGHTVTALYELVPAGVESDVTPPPVDDLRYQKKTKPSKESQSGELLTLKIRYKQPDGDTSTKLTFPIVDEGLKFGQASRDVRFAASVAAFGMLLRNSQYKGNVTYDAVLEIATEAARGDKSGYRKEFLAMIARAKELTSR